MTLDWRDRSHWHPRLLPCRLCDGKTNLRDDQGRPSHKVCAEQEILRLSSPQDGNPAV